ncbi:hypothetical protein OG427_07280 [Streptomyces sp. NBC_00133]|uniref:hypothetical protein n=1 Tax=Streptomyces sp. NBC_00133 TaxID=2903624 RepID=UPI003253658C
MPYPTHDDSLTPERIRQADESLTGLTAHRRTGPSLAEALALLTPLVDEYDGVLARLSRALREVGRYLSQETTVAQSDDAVEAWGNYSDAAAVLKEWNALDWPLPILQDITRHQTAPAGDATDAACR